MHNFEPIWTSKNQDDVIPLVEKALRDPRIPDEGLFFSVDRESTGSNWKFYSLLGTKCFRLDIKVSEEGKLPHQIGTFTFTTDENIYNSVLSQELPSHIQDTLKGKKVICFQYITVDPIWQGKGLSSKAVRYFNAFADLIGTDLVYLTVQSDKPYAGILYKKNQYEFTPESLKRIENFNHAPNDGSSSQKNEAQFLKDSTQALTTPPYMVRYKYGEAPSWKK